MKIRNSSNGQFQTNLSSKYAEITAGRRRNIQLPDFKLTGDKESLCLYLTEEAVTSNMQENIAAFEGWLLALKAWGCADKAELDWKAPSDKGNGHYQRFLYRVDHFRRLFGDWFSIKQEKLLEDSKLNDAKTLVLNSATRNAKVDPDKSSPESILEKDLVESGWLAKTFQLKNLGRQFPVGLFSKNVLADAMVFTGGKSAIDLVGIDTKGVLWVFELKAAGNQRLGIISELLFYTAMMCDLAEGRFKHEAVKGEVPVNRLDPVAIAGINEICGCFLAPAFHPLLGNNLILNLLNDAKARSRNIKIGYRLVELPPSAGSYREAIQ